MDAFSYLSVLISIVVGLALAHLLGGFAAMVRARARIAVFWPLAAQMALMFLIQVQLWWALFSLREITHWSFPAFLVVLLQAVLVYLATAFLVPDIRDGERIDLKECYFREARWFFGALLLAVLDSLVKNLVLTGRFQNAADLVGHAAFISLCIAGIATARERVHKFVAVVALLVFAAYIAVLFIPLPD
ncbi:MAG TPA: hypothetical protein VHT03_08360 [Rhizomicrobium sp.]|nr:hypothetical protein [Rhizomicrobium sp.]